MQHTEYKIPYAYVLCNDNLKVQDRIRYLPIYMLMFIEKKSSAPLSYKIDLSGLK